MINCSTNEVLMITCSSVILLQNGENSSKSLNLPGLLCFDEFDQKFAQVDWILQIVLYSGYGQ